MLNKTKIIILTGKAQSGKDSSSLHIKTLLESKGFSVKIYAFADPLKELCSNLFNIPRDFCWGDNQKKETLTKYRWADFPASPGVIDHSLKNEFGHTDGSLSQNVTVRELLQFWGTNILREYEPDCWVNATINTINVDNPDFAIISDARFPNEIERLLPFDPIIIRLTRDPLKNNHKSETALDCYNFNNCKNTTIIDNKKLTINNKNQELDNILHKVLNQ